MCQGPICAFVVETSNRRLAPAKEDPPSAQVILFNQPGFQTRGPAGTSSISLSGAQPLVSA
jgi:chitin synthase